MCNNVILILFFFVQSIEAFRLFSSDAGTYKEARPFFTSSKSLVVDLFDGNLAQLQQTIHSHTFVFVMYYANFCGISRRMRDPYEKAAAFYHERSHQGNETIDRIHVKFAAIDCFYHEGQCRKSYKLNYFPHMLLYVKGTRGYQYFGPTIKTNLIDFIENIRMPVIRLVNLNDFYEFLVQHETNILAQFDFSNNIHRQYYSLFTQTALKHIEYDNDHPIRFAVILNPTIINELEKLTNQSLEKPFIMFHQLNSVSQIFPNLTNNFTIENLFSWILDQSTKPKVSWLVPKNRYYSRSPSIDKSTIQDALATHDNLLIFLTANKHDELKLREMYFHLTNCSQTSSFWLKQIRDLSNKSRENLTNIEHRLFSSCCQHLLKQMSTTDIYQLCAQNSHFSIGDLFETKQKSCRTLFENENLIRLCYEKYCQNWLMNSTSIYQSKFHNQQNTILQKRKEKFVHQSIKEIDRVSLDKYRAFLCQSNTSWTFRLINSKLYPNFGQNIGLINHSKAIIVLQSKNEQFYTLNANQLTIDSIYKFIYDISKNHLLRTYATIPMEISPTTHSNRLIELTSQTFQSIVFDKTKHVLVVYYTKWCGFCQSIWPVLYQTKAFLKNFQDLIFTRIQADKHDLPWHFTVHNYPTLILFPADRKSDSVVFSTTTDSITSVNLIKFLLYHLYIEDNIHVQNWCPHTNNTFLSMLSSTYIDFSQLSYLIQSYS